jgi:hypothetical protein
MTILHDEPFGPTRRLLALRRSRQAVPCATVARAHPWAPVSQATAAQA